TGLAAGALLAVLVLVLTFAAREHRHGNDLREALRTARRQLAENYLDRALLDSAAVEPDERLLWLARAVQTAPSEAGELQHAIRLNLAAWQRALHPLRALLPHDAEVRGLAFDPAGRYVLIGCADGTTQIEDALHGEPGGQRMKHAHPVLAVAF